jgi:hypothetical protein
MPPDWLATGAARWTVIIGRAAAGAPDQPAVTLIRLTDPHDRLALAPPRKPSPTVAATVASPPASRPEAVRAPEAVADAYPTPWCSPVTLIDRLELLADHPYSSEWARDAIEQLRQLTDRTALSNDDMTARLGRLNALTAEAVSLAEGIQDDRLRAELMRAHWGLVRRLECWGPMREITVASAGANRYAMRGPLGKGSGTGPVDLRALSADLESYERVRSPRLARAIVERQRQLAESPDPNERALADQIDEHYRNSNVRVALSAELLSRYVSQPEPEIRPVHERIAGTPVRGRSQTIAENRVRL